MNDETYSPRSIAADESVQPTKWAAIRALPGAFVAQNMGWGALLGLGISIGWLISMQTLWFAQFICLGGAALSAVYGSIASAVSYFAATSATRFPLVVAGVAFAGTSFGIQLVLIAATNASLGFLVHAAVYSVLGAGVAVLLLRRARRAAGAVPEVSET